MHCTARAVVAVVLSACFCSSVSFAADYPTKPIRFLAAYPPGGTSDILASKVPTVAETLPGFVTESWQGIMAPPRMSPQLVARLNGEIARILKLPDVNEILMSQGTTPIANSSAETHRWFADERVRWAKVVKESGFKLE